MKSPKPDPADVAAAQKERERALKERTDANKTLSRGMTSDFQNAYGSGLSLFNMTTARK